MITGHTMIIPSKTLHWGETMHLCCQTLLCLPFADQWWHWHWHWPGETNISSNLNKYILKSEQIYIFLCKLSSVARQCVACLLLISDDIDTDIDRGKKIYLAIWTNIFQHSDKYNACLASFVICLKMENGSLSSSGSHPTKSLSKSNIKALIRKLGTFPPGI